MKRFITLAQAWLSRHFQSLAIACLVGLMSGLMLAHQPAAAATAGSTPAATVDKTMSAEPRDQAYDEALEVIDDPKGVQKNYEENLKQYRRENPDQESLAEEAKDLVKKITPGR
ncbi:hypothetical protein [Nodosilinea nodulosa]|uniref:hypothetical protein n=1 Tax=Nodosilinea nodulosa TaxID=416001 RepID=UPI000311C80C|nr:hypothetical protein [Nodosilinea nodulosa]